MDAVRRLDSGSTLEVETMGFSDKLTQVMKRREASRLALRSFDFEQMEDGITVQ